MVTIGALFQVDFVDFVVCNGGKFRNYALETKVLLLLLMLSVISDAYSFTDRLAFTTRIRPLRMRYVVFFGI